MGVEIGKIFLLVKESSQGRTGGGGGDTQCTARNGNLASRFDDKGRRSSRGNMATDREKADPLKFRITRFIGSNTS